MHRWGRSWWKWRFSFRKMHCACRKSWYGVNSYLKNHHWSIFKLEISHISLMVFISYLKNDLDRFSNRKWAVYRSRRSFPIWKSLIGWFSNGKWAVHRSWPSFSYSEVDQRASFKKEMSSFSRMALISHTFSFVIHRGAMRQKMAILKRGNSVCRDTIFFRYLILSTQRISEPPDKGGRCNRKCRFSRKETAFAGVQNFTEISFYLHKDYNINNLWRFIINKMSIFSIENINNVWRFSIGNINTCEDYLLNTLTAC